MTSAISPAKAAIFDLRRDDIHPYGRAWRVALPLTLCGNCTGVVNRSPLRLLEDGRPVGRALGAIVKVAELEGGLYLHWMYDLFFSLVDGGDPRHNGRRYQVALPVGTKFDDSPLERQARHFVSMAEHVIRQCDLYGVSVGGTRVLELGPGPIPAIALLLSSMGMVVTVADPRPPQWDVAGHLLWERILHHWDRPDGALRQAMAGNSLASQIRILDQPAENLCGATTASFDVVFSNAVFEHIADPAAAVAELARVSAPGAWHFHQIDFRDHRDFDRPLEHLLLAAASGGDPSQADGTERGGQTRPSELLALFAAHGFQVVLNQTNLLADDAYIAELLPRLRTSPSAYRDWDSADLRVLGALLVLRAPH